MLVQKKGTIDFPVELSPRNVLCARALDDADIMRRKDAQCNRPFSKILYSLLSL